MSRANSAIDPNLLYAINNATNNLIRINSEDTISTGANLISSGASLVQNSINNYLNNKSKIRLEQEEQKTSDLRTGAINAQNKFNKNKYDLESQKITETFKDKIDTEKAISKSEALKSSDELGKAKTENKFMSHLINNDEYLKDLTNKWDIKAKENHTKSILNHIQNQATADNIDSIKNTLSNEYKSKAIDSNIQTKYLFNNQNKILNHKEKVLSNETFNEALKSIVTNNAIIKGNTEGLTSKIINDMAQKSYSDLYIVNKETGKKTLNPMYYGDIYTMINSRLGIENFNTKGEESFADQLNSIASNTLTTASLGINKSPYNMKINLNSNMEKEEKHYRDMETLENNIKEDFLASNANKEVMKNPESIKSRSLFLQGKKTNEANNIIANNKSMRSTNLVINSIVEVNNKDLATQLAVVNNVVKYIPAFKNKTFTQADIGTLNTLSGINFQNLAKSEMKGALTNNDLKILFGYLPNIKTNDINFLSAYRAILLTNIKESLAFNKSFKRANIMSEGELEKNVLALMYIENTLTGNGIKVDGKEGIKNPIEIYNKIKKEGSNPNLYGLVKARAESIY